ncbi:hypothetical protein [Marinobacter sp. F4206]|uniref:hypothetical protein n=1 Tax=Marinobacter sp. F4206 TaxID=2861777 RepID=UPI001C5E832F|nr:hypothetical protein [Marinobacter sp. F4206]MBW4936660.1 hypothetical protein [Marinobacter sp. F4206]
MIEYSKSDIAMEYLDAAIEERELHQRYFAAMNLAGVAEELFGKLVRVAGEKDRLTSTIEDLSYIQEKLWGKMGWAKQSPKDLKKLLVSPKNSIKHMDNGADSNAKLHFEVEDESKWMIQSAIRNMDALGLERSEAVRRFLLKHADDDSLDKS